MTFLHFTSNQFLPFVFSAVFIISSVIFYHLDKKKTGLLLLFIGSLCLGFFIANLDHFLIIWDEQYHALVAKHLTENPFKPTLYDHPLFYQDYRVWTFNHIWLHKQPLFLWQIALSLKIFGFNELAVRIPSILLHAIAPLMIYRIGKISSTDKTGYYGALFFAVAYYPLELVAGRYSTDHNDVSFLFYITASLWAWFEYQRSHKRYYLVLTGLFAGCAVLVKWLVGLLVYGVWLVAIWLGDKNNRMKLKSYFPLMVSLSITFLVFIPWQLFILWKYPLESRYEFLLNTKHFFEPLEGHGGDGWFYFRVFKDIYGSGFAVPFIYIAGLFLLLKNVTSRVYRVAILSAIIITYSFYTLAATKMTSFCIIAAPFAFLGLGSLVDSTANFLKSKIVVRHFDMIFRSIVVTVICFFVLNLSKIENYHTIWKPDDNCNRKAELAEMEFIGKLKDQLKNEKYVVFNATARVNGNIAVMFYTDYIAYDFIPTTDQIADVYSKDYKIAILDNGTLPDYLRDNPEILKIKL